MTTLPDIMTAIEISRPGGPEVLVPTNRPVPKPQRGEVLIRVVAAGINRPDCWQRQGGYSAPPGSSDLPGLEVAGEIVAVGPAGLNSTLLGRAPWKVGDRVTALLAGGGYAEYVCTPGVQCLPIPGRLTLVEAAALPETFFTVWTNVFDRGRLKAGEVALIHGGSSGIGTTAIQLARAFGARAFVTAGSDEKCKACAALGAERAINYRNEDFVEVVKQTAGGADVVLDMVGGPYVSRNLAVLNTEGRLVQINTEQGGKVEFDLNLVMRKRLFVTGSTLRPRTPEQKAKIATALLAQVWPLIADGRVKPLIHKTFPLNEASSAHALMESSEHIGKIVLTI
ncbi:NAD(P)H-quinone oxidoreductase [Bradyrhizobium cajani]|uniref:Zinc-binding dehydrogenase n=1 Tax=Bradyrhizobium cajani TaxID=1928661 RepID=A0A844TBC3_9BRAD|nr:NAD(P)H-quinone oxidoreductase [Bradyrhizobium cajani]MCP3371786.1 NAD(P)H-quinone oxidoreductase [Bradyrhizobium cajani]MVT76393.1 zinc-binding dehydrogenase [Bradyrhizobium cajani]